MAGRRRHGDARPGRTGALTSGAMPSPWTAGAKPLLFPPLDSGIRCSVAVIGGGIAGLSVAYRLARQGKDVVLIEDGAIGSGETGRSTAHITCMLDEGIGKLEHAHGRESAILAIQSHVKALAEIRKTVREEKIECGFEDVDAYLFLAPGGKRETLVSQMEGLSEAGVEGLSLLDSAPDWVETDSACLRIPMQAQFNPLRYVQGLAKAAERQGAKIFCSTHASEIKEGEITTDKGLKIAAKHVVVATNSPVNDRLAFASRQYAYRTYVIAAKIPKGSFPHSLWWDTEEPYHYVRAHRLDSKSDLLIAGGEDEKSGQHADYEKKFASLEGWARKFFPKAGQVLYRWSGQIMEPADYLAFIGRAPGSNNTYVVTGDSGNGITHGTIAGILIPDLIFGRENAWEKLYSPSRIPLGSLPSLVSENVNAAASYAGRLATPKAASAPRLRAGEGKVAESEGEKLAYYRERGGKTRKFSAICPHLGCVVKWNSLEKTFDCPCHGSRFSREGKVINGPAISGLEEKKEGG